MLAKTCMNFKTPWARACAALTFFTPFAWCVVLAVLNPALAPAAHAADVSAAAAAALKVLALPLPDGRPSGETGPHNAANPPGMGAQLASSAAAQAPAMSVMPTTAITVQKGEGIDAVLRRGLPGLPLSPAFMRQALAKANPRIFPRGNTYPVKPGTVLQLPTPEALGQLMLAQYPQSAALFARPTQTAEPEASTGPDKRRWVRFP
jgi:hypothetical protein